MTPPGDTRPGTLKTTQRTIPPLSKTQLKHERRLAIASAVMREKGVLTTRLQDVAKALNIAHPAIYNYFRNASHMAEEVLTWNLALRLEHLTSARGESALDRLLDFVMRDLLEDREKKVGIPVLIALPEDHRAPVQAARDKLVLAVARLVQDGVDEGSIRPVHALTVANFIVHNVESYIRFDNDFPAAIQRLPLAAVALKVTEVLRFGALLHREQLPHPSSHISRGEELLGPGSTDDPEMDRFEAILRAVTRQFNRDGGRASIPAVATELGVSKTVIYQYAQDKHDLLFLCYERSAGVLTLNNLLAIKQAQNPLDETLISHTNLYRFHASPAGPLTNLDAMQYLKPTHARIVRLRNRALRDFSIARRQRAMQAGFLRPDIDPVMLQPMMDRGIHNLPSWYESSYPLTIGEISYQDLTLLYQGLAPLD